MTTAFGDNYGVLTVSKNKFKINANLNMVTYYLEAKYTEPESGQELTARGQITFSLIRQAANIKTCSITGENIFKYDTNQKLISSSSIVLNGTVENVDISKWQYKKSDGTYADYPSGTITGTTLTVSATDSVFINDIATIKLVTSDSNVFDIFGVYKLYDGAAGASVFNAILSNEDQMIPCDSNGTPVAGAFNGASTTITVLEGGKDVSTSWTITATPTNVTGT